MRFFHFSWNPTSILIQATFGFGIQPAVGRCFWNPTVLTFGFGIQPAVGSCFWNPAVLSGLSWNPNTLLPVQLESNYDFVKYVYCQLDPVPGIRRRGCYPPMRTHQVCLETKNLATGGLRYRVVDGNPCFHAMWGISSCHAQATARRWGRHPTPARSREPQPRRIPAPARSRASRQPAAGDCP